jgi:hypothetical protein
MIEKNKDEKVLKAFLSVLCEGRRERSSTISREAELYVFSYIALTYKTELDDGTGQHKLIIRIINAIHSYFGDMNSCVRQACARALCDCYVYALADQPNLHKILLIYEPLAAILLTGLDRITQETAAICLNEFVILIARNEQHKEILTEVSFKYLGLFPVCHCQSPCVTNINAAV